MSASERGIRLRNTCSYVAGANDGKWMVGSKRETRQRSITPSEASMLRCHYNQFAILNNGSCSADYQITLRVETLILRRVSCGRNSSKIHVSDNLSLCWNVWNRFVIES